MCMSSPKVQAAPPPATPPPPPPVLEQVAPKTATSTTGQQMDKRSSGTKKYRNSLGISAGDNQVGNTNLAIST